MRPVVPKKRMLWLRHHLRAAGEHAVAGWILEDGGGQHVDVAELRVARDGAADAQRFFAEHHARSLDGVAADIHQRAAAVCADVADVVGVQVEIAECAHGGAQLADAAGAHQLHDAQPLGVGLHHEGLADDDAGAVAHGHQLAALPRRSWPIGFSQSTCLPASAARMDHGTCR